MKFVLGDYVKKNYLVGGSDPLLGDELLEEIFLCGGNKQIFGYWGIRPMSPVGKTLDVDLPEEIYLILAWVL